MTFKMLEQGMGFSAERLCNKRYGILDKQDKAIQKPVRIAYRLLVLKIK